MGVGGQRPKISTQGWGPPAEPPAHLVDVRDHVSGRAPVGADRSWPLSPSLYPKATPPQEDGRGFLEAPELEGGPSAPRLPASASETPGLGSREEVHCPAGPCPASRGTQPSAGRDREEGGAPGAQPAKSNLIEQETGLQPDKASTNHLEPLFPLFPLGTFPGTCSGASGAPGPGRGSHGIDLGPFLFLFSVPHAGSTVVFT